MRASSGKRQVFAYLVVGAMLFGADLAEAKPFKVKITSKPSGATVLLGTGKTLGKTPLSTRIESGEHVIILRKQGYVETVETIDVGRRSRRFRYTLERAEMGEIRVISKKRKVLNGAEIYVDGKKVGTVPATISVEAGTRQVEVKKSGYDNFDEWVEVNADDTVVVKAFAKAKSGKAPPPETKGDDDDDEGADNLGDDDDIDDGDDDDIGDDDDDDDGTKVAAAGGSGSSDSSGDSDTAKSDVSAGVKTARPLGSLATIRAGLDFGGRIFSYSNPQTANLRPYSAFAIPIGRLDAEIYPLGFMDSILSGLGVTATVGFGAPLKSEADVNGMAEAVDTTWRDWSVGARFKLGISPALDVAVGGAYGKMSFNFADENTGVDGEVPDVDYTQTSLSLDVESKATESVTVVLGGRFILLSGFGELADRFTVSSSLGLGAVARVDVALTPRFDLVFRVAYQLASLDLEMSDPAFNADGGTDQLLGGMVGLGVNL